MTQTLPNLRQLVQIPSHFLFHPCFSSTFMNRYIVLESKWVASNPMLILCSSLTSAVHLIWLSSLILASAANVCGPILVVSWKVCTLLIYFVPIYSQPIWYSSQGIQRGILRCIPISKRMLFTNLAYSMATLPW